MFRGFPRITNGRLTGRGGTRPWRAVFFFSQSGGRGDMSQQGRRNSVLAVLLVIALIAVGVLGYLYYRQQQDVVKIDVPGFSGEITKDDGVDINIGKDKD
jgi:hypothetical protein